MRPLHEANRRAWNAATPAHNSHKRDQVAFFRAGGGTLFPEERKLLGNLKGRALVHLQCNAGQDTLSLARLGARVTGVDISDEAIAFARELSKATDIPARFVRADVYDWLETAARAGQRYEIAFASYGFLAWLSDLAAWARGILQILEPGGRLVLVEFHPFALLFDEDFRPSFPYFSAGEPLTFEPGIGDYVADAGEALAPSGFEAGVKDFRNPHPCHEWLWSLSDLFTALLGAGFLIEHFKEFPYANGFKMYARMQRLPGNRWTVPADVPALPLMFALAARKP